MKTLFIGAQGSNVTDDGFQHLSVENGSNTFVSRWPNMFVTLSANCCAFYPF